MTTRQTYFTFDDTPFQHVIVMLCFLFIALATYILFMAWVIMEHSVSTLGDLKENSKNNTTDFFLSLLAPLLLWLVRQNQAGFKYGHCLSLVFKKKNRRLSFHNLHCLDNSRPMLLPSWTRGFTNWPKDRHKQLQGWISKERNKTVCSVEDRVN